MVTILRPGHDSDNFMRFIIGFNSPFNSPKDFLKNNGNTPNSN